MGVRRVVAALVVGLCLVDWSRSAGNETNILKLSKPKGNVGTRSDANSSKNEAAGSGGRPLVEFSKNNPELDWKTHLRKVAELEEKMRSKEFDLDFMTNKLEKTANSIQWLVDLYDPLRWTKIPGDVANECRRDMTMFLDNLRAGVLWAAKCEYAASFGSVFLL